MTTESTVFVVDDDPDVRKSLHWLVTTTMGLHVEAFDSAEAFLAGYEGQRGCLLLDVKMPHMSGMDLQKELIRRDGDLPVIIITGHGEIPMAVEAMKSGALDFIEKPFDRRALIQRIRQALDRDRAEHQQHQQVQDVRNRINTLTRRERQVMDMVVAGLLNKQVAKKLDISPRTVEDHRARVMEKIGAHSVADLVRLVLPAQMAAQT